MELFRKNGQEARKIFTQIAKSLEEKLDNFHVQKISSWMNQAQIARPFLWVFFKREDESVEEPEFALRVFKNEKTKKQVSPLRLALQKEKLEKIPLKGRIKCQIYRLSHLYIILFNIKTAKMTVNSKDRRKQNKQGNTP